MTQIILWCIIGYLIGSVPWGLVIGKVFYHKDIREYGSGNLGGTNAARVLGTPVGILVILLDALKAFLVMSLNHYIAPGIEQYCGLAVCIGHCFPISLILVVFFNTKSLSANIKRNSYKIRLYL